MAADRTLSTSWRLSDLPGWQGATEAEAAGAGELARNFLEPLSRRWGRIAVTSWLRDSGSGAHLDPGTADVVPLDAPVRDVHLWATRELAGTFGELLHELRGPGEVTDHIHRTRWGVGGHGESLRELPPAGSGQWEPVHAWELPPFGDPVGPRARSWWAFGIILLALWSQRGKP